MTVLKEDGRGYKADFLAGIEVCNAIFWPAPSFEESTFDKSGFSAEVRLEKKKKEKKLEGDKL